VTEQEMAQALTAAGYLVVKIPDCKHGGGHGRHTLITRSAMCEGAEPIPHGWVNGHSGSFGWRNICACGRSFADYNINDDDTSPTAWQKHQAETGAA
jgi:hypothetical protein